jgi:hypothetical protein
MRALIFLLGGAAALLIWALAFDRRGAPPPGLPLAPEPASGMALLEGYRCHRAETKRLVTRGAEDDFSPAGDEPSRAHPRLIDMDWISYARNADYDEQRDNAAFIDYLELPGDLASALLVIRMRPISENSNDEVMIGDLSTYDRQSLRHSLHRIFQRQLAASRAWTRHGDLFSAELADLKMASGEMVIDRLREQGAAAVLDVGVADDTAVDFIGVAACERPRRTLGLTYRVFENGVHREAKLAQFRCSLPGSALSKCDPFQGDHPCKEPLPLLCYRDLGAPEPDLAGIVRPGLGAREKWSGGEANITPPVPGEAFQTIAEADAHCARTFGAGWRVADWHLAPNGYDFLARVDDPARFEGGRVRAWIDIKDQPYATCWRRS